MVSNPIKRFWTLEEYLVHEQETHLKHEFIDGEIYAMTGGTDKHSEIKAQTLIAIGTQLRGSKCRVYDSDMRVKISDTKYVYPDMSVVYGEAQFADKKRTMLSNPTLIVEVISETSAGFDRGQKAEFYRSLPSVEAYLLLDQSRIFAQIYIRQELGWLLREFEGEAAIVPLDAIGISLALRDAYFDVNFEEETTSI